jgi:hypothetical protein
MFFEVIADNVLNNHFAVIEVSQPDCVSQSLLCAWREIRWE